jgi:hypothetical protein
MRRMHPWKRAAIAACALLSGGGCVAPDGGGVAAHEPPQQSAPAAVPLDPGHQMHFRGPSLDDCVSGWTAERARLDPFWATRAGVHEHDHRLTRFDDVSWAERKRLAQETLAVVEPMLARDLPPAAATDARLFHSQLLFEVHEFERHDARAESPGLPLTAIAAVNDVLVRDFAPAAQRAILAVARLSELPAVVTDARAALGRPPRLWTEMALDELDGALRFLDSVPELAGPTPGLAEALAGARAALRDYRAWLAEVVLTRSDGSYALGRAEFEWRLRHLHLLDLDAERLLALGREQFALTLRLLEETAHGIDPSRAWQEQLAEMMTQHPPLEGLLDAYRAEAARARQWLLDEDLLGLPEESLQIRETPAFLRTTTPFAAYDSPAPLDQSRLGTFWVTPDPQAHILSDIPGTTWHEAYPGHHTQLVYAKDNPSPVRRLNESPLLSEGWGLYCEELAHESGYYDDPRERLMQLNWRLQRAARVILDTSIHAFGMTHAEAVDFLVRQVGLSRETAVASANAYTQSPTYFSTYLLGMLEIMRLREACRARLGARFTLREFHERLLRCGNVPPALIEAELAGWR